MNESLMIAEVNGRIEAIEFLLAHYSRCEDPTCFQAALLGTGYVHQVDDWLDQLEGTMFGGGEFRGEWPQIYDYFLFDASDYMIESLWRVHDGVTVLTPLHCTLSAVLLGVLASRNVLEVLSFEVLSWPLIEFTRRTNQMANELDQFLAWIDLSIQLHTSGYSIALSRGLSQWMLGSRSLNMEDHPVISEIWNGTLLKLGISS